LVNRVVDVIQSQQQGELRMHHQHQRQYHSQWQQQQLFSKLSISDERRMNKGGCDGGDDGGGGEKNEEEVGCCGALYLHVITYNKGAIRMYERLGFMRVKKIEGERCSC
jgi:ribosomal protein S18 acetylase RimI-like enzyme